jgi:uncharacterized protein involved in exopolysaccharide biosynthesis
METRETPQGTSHYQEEDEISLKELIQKIKELFQYFWIFRFWIVLVGLTGGGLGFAYAHFFKEVQYTSKLTFAIEEKSVGGGSILGLASQFGIDLGGGGGGGSMFSSTNLTSLLKSNRIIQGALLKPMPELKEENLLNLYIRIYQKESLKNKKISFISSDLDRSKFTRAQDSLLSLTSSQLAEELEIGTDDKKSSFLFIKVKSTNEEFAFLFNQMLVQEASDMYIDMKVGKSKKSLVLLQSRVDSVQRVLDGSMRSAAVDMDLSLGLVSMAPRVSATKKQMETQMLGTLYAELTKNLELTKFTLGREEPVIQVIDVPTMPLLKEGKGRVKSSFFGGLIAGFLMLGFLFGKRFLDGL